MMTRRLRQAGTPQPPSLPSGLPPAGLPPTCLGDWTTLHWYGPPRGGDSPSRSDHMCKAQEVSPGLVGIPNFESGRTA